MTGAAVVTLPPDVVVTTPLPPVCVSELKAGGLPFGLNVNRFLFSEREMGIYKLIIFPILKQLI